jgi:hypothetical protein
MREDILHDDSAFSDSFIPRRLMAREGIIREIARILEPIKNSRSPRNIFLWSAAPTNDAGSATIRFPIIHVQFHHDYGALPSEFGPTNKLRNRLRRATVHERKHCRYWPHAFACENLIIDYHHIADLTLPIYN